MNIEITISFSHLDAFNVALLNQRLYACRVSSSLFQPKISYASAMFFLYYMKLLTNSSLSLLNLLMLFDGRLLYNNLASLEIVGGKNMQMYLLSMYVVGIHLPFVFFYVVIWITSIIVLGYFWHYTFYQWRLVGP